MTLEYKRDQELDSHQPRISSSELDEYALGGYSGKVSAAIKPEKGVFQQKPIEIKNKNIFLFGEREITMIKEQLHLPEGWNLANVLVKRDIAELTLTIGKEIISPKPKLDIRHSFKNLSSIKFMQLKGDLQEIYSEKSHARFKIPKELVIIRGD